VNGLLALVLFSAGVNPNAQEVPPADSNVILPLYVYDSGSTPLTLIGWLKGRVLSCLIKKGMTEEQVRKILGRADGVTNMGACYFAYGLWVEYTFDFIEAKFQVNHVHFLAYSPPYTAPRR